MKILPFTPVIWLTLTGDAIASDLSATLPDLANAKVFQLLIATFVLALLLESAFALLFNWRLFREFLVGKAWRTPIMLVGASMAVALFDFNLVDRIFRVYGQVGADADKHGAVANAFTGLLSAMILAGGSVGVNRIFVRLGFRAVGRREADAPELDLAEAWISVRVDRLDPGDLVTVNIAEMDSETSAAQTLAGVLRRPRSNIQRIRDLFYPSYMRVPRSGGRRVSTESAYRISVSNHRTGKHYDALGNEVANINAIAPLRFASRAVVDFSVSFQ